VTADREIRLNNTVRSTERRIDFAIFLAQHQHLCADAGRELSRRRRGIKAHRQLLEVERHQFGGILGECCCLGEHRRHRFAHIAHAVTRQQRLPVRLQRFGSGIAEIDRR
jgi:hypothetical protein